jgi:hypothetical protein
MEENQYFVHIRDPVDIRRTILGSSKQIIQVLQRYERIKALRVKKLEKIALLRNLNKEINLLVAKLKKGLPVAEMRVKLKEEKTVNGKMLKVTVMEGAVTINDAKVTSTDIVASNGVIHVIDTVVLPPAT